MKEAIKQDGWVLTHVPTGMPVLANELMESFRGDQYRITGGRPPHKPSSEGFVWTADNRELYPSVFECKWIKQA